MVIMLGSFSIWIQLAGLSGVCLTSPVFLTTLVTVIMLSYLKKFSIFATGI